MPCPRIFFHYTSEKQRKEKNICRNLSKLYRNDNILNLLFHLINCLNSLDVNDPGYMPKFAESELSCFDRFCPLEKKYIKTNVR